ncbi:hypothetical protein WDV76_17135 [Xenorhabdus griffiniae]|uniref:AbrB/MazE/SpoVT family DNA-binding domain-containing protein n=1 Tax=Xenorhabdus griffiniae TaxID=351672 RepID=UPI0030D3F04C
MSTAIKKWGNSQGIIIPTHILNQVGLKTGVLNPLKEKRSVSTDRLLFFQVRDTIKKLG